MFIKDFKKETDRAAVILGVAKLDLILYQMIQATLIPNPHSKDELLDDDGPLSTFSSKINLAYRLGIIDAGYARALHLCRRIRNEFAHEVAGCNLESGVHRDRVKELCKPLKELNLFEDVRESFFGNKSTAATDFRTLLAIMVAALEYHLQRLKTLSQDKCLSFIKRSWLEKKSDDSSKGT
jgi:hypothetical protein